MSLNKEEVTVEVARFGKNAADTGSASVQIALLTKRIAKLNDHIKDNGQDPIARRSLLILVGKRRRLLNYLAKNDRDEYVKVLNTLGLRK